MVTEIAQTGQVVPVPNQPKDYIYFPLVSGTKVPPKDFQWRLVGPCDYKPSETYGISLQADDLVIDADPRNYPPGRDVLAELLTCHPSILPTFVVRTPSGGYHLYLKKPADVGVKKIQDAYPGIDFLSAGQYVVGPGSVLSSGSNRTAGVYAIESQAPINKVPDSLLTALQKKGETSATSICMASPSLAHEKEFEAICMSAPPAEKGSRDSKAIKLAGQGWDLGLPSEVVFEQMRVHWNPRCKPPLEDAKLHTDVEHSYKYAKNPFGCNNIDAKFETVYSPYTDVSTPPAQDEKQSTAANYTAPYPYKLTTDGVFIKRDEDKPGDLICGPLMVTAITRGVAGETAGGLVLEFRGIGGDLNKLTIPRTRLHEDGRLLAQDLASCNFYIKPGKEANLLSYIAACRPKKELLAVAHTGWVPPQSESGKLVFVFPWGATDPDYCYQPERASDATPCKVTGTLDDWLSYVFAPVRTNQYCLYEILKSLAACLLKFAPAQCSENLYGATTRGKTTLMQLGASVWGCGADPAAEPKTAFIHTWNTTANALEGLLARHNDLPVYFDELGTFSGAGFSELVYTITGGAGKAAMKQNRSLRAPRSWRTIVTSTGEKTIKEKIEEVSFGRKTNAKGGQLIRIVDREIKESTFANGAQVQSLKQACGRFYGTLGRAFVQKLIEQYNDTTLAETVSSLVSQAKNRISTLGYALNAAQERIAQRFYLIEATGQLLVSFCLIPALTSAEVSAAIDKVLTDWLPTSHNISDVSRAVIALREFYLTHRDTRFKTVSQSVEFGGTTYGDSAEPLCSQAYRDIAGFVDRARQFVDFYPHTIKEATGLGVKDVACEIDKLGLLVKRAGRLTNKRRFEGSEINVYRVRLAFLEEADDTVSDLTGLSTEDKSGKLNWSGLI